MRKTNDDEILSMLKDGNSQKEIAEHFNVSPAAICKRVKRLLPPPESLGKLTEKEQKFAIERAKGKTQTQAALSSHECSSLASAKSLGSQLMKKPEVKLAISELMEHHGMDRSYRIAKLKTHVDSPDGHLSLKALDQSWKLDGAYAEEEVKAQFNYELATLTLRELEKELEKIEKELGGEDVIDVEVTEVTNPDDRSGDGK
jgi:hypothetical protein